MADAGWYPDPGGSGQFRYWDGATWSAQLSVHASAPPPGGRAGPGRTGQNAGRRRAIGAVIGIVTLVVVLGVIALVVFRPFSDGTEITDPPPANTITPGDDGAPSTPPPSATPTPSSTPTASPTATPTPSPSAASPQGQVPCPVGDPSIRADHPDDGRVHGGGLSIAAIKNWNLDQQVSGMSFAYDVSTLDYHVEPTWLALSSVGALRIADGFDDPEQAAAEVMECISTTTFYTSLNSVEPVTSQAVTVDGHRGWSMQARFLCDVPNHPEISGDLVQVVVVDVGGGESLGMYLGTATIDDTYTLDAMTAAVASLQVD